MFIPEEVDASGTQATSRRTNPPNEGESLRNDQALFNAFFFEGDS